MGPVHSAEEMRHETVFSDNRGCYADGKLSQGSDGWLYGTTNAGGLLNKGTVFRVSPLTGQLTTLGCFNGFNGKYPNAGLVQADDGSWFGTTLGAENIGYGTLNSIIFRLSPSGMLQTFVSLSGRDAASVKAGLIRGSDGNYYGTSAEGGANSNGSIFRMSPTGVIKLMASFNGSNGRGPSASLMQGSDGNFYGTTIGGEPMIWEPFSKCRLPDLSQIWGHSVPARAEIPLRPSRKVPTGIFTALLRRHPRRMWERSSGCRQRGG